MVSMELLLLSVRVLSLQSDCYVIRCVLMM